MENKRRDLEFGRFCTFVFQGRDGDKRKRFHYLFVLFELFGCWESNELLEESELGFSLLLLFIRGSRTKEKEKRKKGSTRPCFIQLFYFMRKCAILKGNEVFTLWFHDSDAQKLKLKLQRSSLIIGKVSEKEEKSYSEP